MIVIATEEDRRAPYQELNVEGQVRQPPGTANVPNTATTTAHAARSPEARNG
jgi:hypothetical protein